MKGKDNTHSRSSCAIWVSLLLILQVYGVMAAREAQASEQISVEMRAKPSGFDKYSAMRSRLDLKSE